VTSTEQQLLAAIVALVANALGFFAGFLTGRWTKR
jgi:hypothetical protein